MNQILKLKNMFGYELNDFLPWMFSKKPASSFHYFNKLLNLIQINCFNFITIL